MFDCKPLPLLWARYPAYKPSNTVMLDDLRRNYVFNRQQVAGAGWAAPAQQRSCC